MRKNEDRPHFYHVICYDLICETIKKMHQEGDNQRSAIKEEGNVFDTIA